ncbi:ASKHA domain-containing protein [Dehalobacter sp. DCM]|uniref:ASKHA domain-containing protein n=1 Tax=Dehalobacter sp. DCM TaxID=2907827 RepID=UPI003FCEA310
MVNITFQKSACPGGECIGTVPAGSTILQAAIAAGVHLQSACGGKGTCGKCRVILPPEYRSEPLPEEKKFLSDEQIRNGIVLACKRHVQEDMAITLIQQKDVYDRKTQLEKADRRHALSPYVHKYDVNVSTPTITDQRSDWERLMAELPESHSIFRFNRRVAAKLPGILRGVSSHVTAVTAGDEILAVETGDTRDRFYGLAIDIGTTTIVVYLMNLNDGKVVARGALTNPQQGAGADVLSRIAYTADHPGGLSQLQSLVVEGLNHIISDLCREKEINSEQIYQAVVVGNTTMSHLFLGIDPTYLATAPFIPGFRQTVSLKASELGLNILGDGIVTILPIVAGYVGSDTIGVMLSGQIDTLKGIHLLLDIGTNGEMVLVGKGRILTCSTAAGPTFEGAGVKYGMRAADGAIERVRISDDVELGVIGKETEKVRGICGSGLIEAVSEMFRVGIITSEGRMITAESDIAKLSPALQERIIADTGGREFVLAWKDQTVSGENVTITQKDIRGLQLAKGAILAGIRVLMAHLEVSPEDIEMIHLAGAFGNYISRESALGIGLLPQVPLAKIQSIGNAAGNGAQMALLSTIEMAKANQYALVTEHIELSADKLFQDEFLEALALG